MRIAVVSDIHGNMEAFDQVITDIQNQRVDQIFSLGDNIGYGPDSEAVICQIRRHQIPSIIGNHELGAIKPECLHQFNPLARESLIKISKQLSDSSLAYMEKRKKVRVAFDGRFVHGFPPDSPLIYLFQASDSQIIHKMKEMPEKLCFLGHTHLLGLTTFDGEKIWRTSLNQDIITLKKENKYLVNIGSVGQPRDGDPRAKYVIWDRTMQTIEAKCISYNIATTVKKISDIGLPKHHATRLWKGR